MKNLKLKVCGMKFPDNIQKTAGLGTDYMGFIFYEKSPRYFENEIPEISSEIKKTGVFVDASLDFVLKQVKKYDLKAVQLHGKEPAGYCSELKRNLASENAALEIIKVFSVKEDFDFDLLKDYEGMADYFLFDTKGKTKGGTGITFNWEILKNYPSSTPFFLSGGIGLEEIEGLKVLVADLEKQGKGHLLYAVDVNSRFETEPGLKDVLRLKIFKKELLD